MNEINMKNITERGWPWDPTHLVLDQRFEYDTGKRGVDWMSPDGLFEIRDGVAICFPGISWDGTTCVPDGGPDPVYPHYPLTWRASLIHDQICKYTRESEEFRKYYSRADGDRYLYKLLKSCHFKWAEVYYVGVRFWSIVAFFKRVFHK